MDRRNYAFGKTNFIMLAAGMAVVIIGFLLMGGTGSNEHEFVQDIFSARRIKVAPAVCFAGLAFIIYAVMRRPKDGEPENDNSETAAAE